MHCCALVNHHHRKNKLRGNKQVFNRVCIQVQQKHSKWFETELWAEYIVHCLSQGWKGETWISFYLSKVRGEFLKSAKKEKKIVEFLKPPNTKPTQNSESTRSAVEVKPGSLQVRILWRNSDWEKIRGIPTVGLRMVLPYNTLTPGDTTIGEAWRPDSMPGVQ